MPAPSPSRRPLRAAAVAGVVAGGLLMPTAAAAETQTLKASTEATQAPGDLRAGDLGYGSVGGTVAGQEGPGTAAAGPPLGSGSLATATNAGGALHIGWNADWVGGSVSRYLDGDRCQIEVRSTRGFECSRPMRAVLRYSTWTDYDGVAPATMPSLVLKVLVRTETGTAVEYWAYDPARASAQQEIADARWQTWDTTQGDSDQQGGWQRYNGDGARIAWPSSPWDVEEDMPVSRTNAGIPRGAYLDATFGAFRDGRGILIVAGDVEAAVRQEAQGTADLPPAPAEPSGGGSTTTTTTTPITTTTTTTAQKAAPAPSTVETLLRAAGATGATSASVDAFEASLPSAFVTSSALRSADGSAPLRTLDLESRAPDATPSSPGSSTSPERPSSSTAGAVSPFTPSGSPTALTHGRPACSSRRSFVIRVRRSAGRLRSVRATVDGKRATVRRRADGRYVVRVDVRGREGSRRFVVRLRARTTTGKRLRATRTYRPCRVKPLKPINTASALSLAGGR